MGKPGIQTSRIAKMTRYKRRKVTNYSAIKRDHVIFTSSPPPSPFNSTASLVRQRSRQQKEAGLPPILDEPPELDQYGSNHSKDVIARCTFFAASSHEQGPGDYKVAQPDHPVIVELSLQSLACYHSVSHLELQQAKLPDDINPPQPERNHYHGASSATTRKLEDQLAWTGHETMKHQRAQSVTDDNFDILLSNEATSEIGDLRINFCALGISETMRLA